MSREVQGHAWTKPKGDAAKHDQGGWVVDSTLAFHLPSQTLIGEEDLRTSRPHGYMCRSCGLCR